MLVERDVPCQVRDGTTLATDVYRPDDGERHPVLLTRTPYDKTYLAGSVLDPLRAALGGFAVAIQDVRGRFASEGDFRSYVNEAQDGSDAVQWAAAQPWSNGEVGMFGVSYMAQSQLLAASQQPAALRAIMPIESPSHATGGDQYRGGALQLGTIASWAVTAIVPAEVLRRARVNPNYYAEFPAVVDDIDELDERMRRLPLVPWPPIDERAGGLGTEFDGIVRGDFLPPQPRFAHSDIKVPAFVVAAWNDCFLQVGLDHYCALRTRAGSEEARNLTRLWVGPWSHGAVTQTVGELDYGFRTSPFMLDMKEDLTSLGTRWFAARLQAKNTHIDEEPPVKIFVMGVNRWRFEEEWPPARAREQKWYLRGDGGFSTSAPSHTAEPTPFALDPDDPVTTRGGGLLMQMKYLRGSVEQARTEAHKDVRVFTSSPLDAPLEVVGRIKLRAFVASETPDTDLVARLCDVHPDGLSYNIVDGILRLRYRNGLDRPQPLPIGEPVEVEVDLWSTAHVFKAGHRLRVHICASDFPRYDRCPGTGETSAEVSRVLPQRNLLFHDPERPTHFLLPVISD